MPDWTPIELDLYLQTRYSCSLWHFAVHLHLWYSLFFESLPGEDFIKKKSRGISWTKYWNLRIKELEDFKSQSLKILNKTLTKINFNHPMLKDFIKDIPFHVDEKYIKKNFNLNPLFETIDNLIREIKNEILDLKDLPSKFLNLIAYIWSFYIRDSDRACIIDIVGLLKWFSRQLQHPTGINLFFKGIEKLKSKNLAMQFYRYKERDKLRNFINQQKKIFKYKVSGICISFKYFGIEISSQKYEMEMGNINPALVTFPTGEKFYLFDFKENWKKAHQDNNYLT